MNPERISAIASTIQNRAENSPRFIVAIVGAPGSGKSTLAENLRTELCRIGENAIVVPMDGFHFDDVILNARGERLRKGAQFTFDVYGFIKLLERIRDREPEIAIPVFHREQEVAHAGERIISGDARIVLVEGNYLLLKSAPWNQLQPLFDFTIALDVPIEELERRLIQRWLELGFDIDAARNQVASNDMLNVQEVIINSVPADLRGSMRIWNFGSINNDIVYQVPSIVSPGETIAASERSTSPGGKGLNQSVAAARAGALVYHIGRIGDDGDKPEIALRDAGVNTTLIIKDVQVLTGHAVIQRDSRGENSIVLFPGANATFLREEIDSILDKAAPEDWVLVQNETNLVDRIINGAARRGLKVAYNPAPVDPRTTMQLLRNVNLLIVNEGELEQISGIGSAEEGLDELTIRLPNTRVIVTLGAEGCIYKFGAEPPIRIPPKRVQAIDTTGAGDTFVGYFLAEFASTNDVMRALLLASRAAAIAVTRRGAADSIPLRSEVIMAHPDAVQVNLSDIEEVDIQDLEESRLHAIENSDDWFDDLVSSPSNSITLNMTSTPYKIIEGRHRIFLCRQKGYHSIPAISA